MDPFTQTPYLPEYNMQPMQRTVILNRWFILAVLFWIFFFCTAISGIAYLAKDKNITFVWMIMKINDPEVAKKHYIPIQIEKDYLLGLFITVVGITLAQFGYYILCALSGDPEVTTYYVEGCTRVHFIPLGIISALFIVGISLNEELAKKGDKVDQVQTDKYAYTSLALSTAGLAALIWTHHYTNFQSFFKKLIMRATYACFISLFVYNLFYTIVYLYDEVNSKLSEETQTTEQKWLANCGLAFSILVGLLNIGAGVGLRSAFILIINMAIYGGMILYFFNIEESVRNDYNGNKDGIIDIVVLAISFFAIFITVSSRFTW